jgi:hypothetical protein
MQNDASSNGPLPKTEEEAVRVADAARERGVTAAPLGGVAIFMRCPSAARPPLQREYKDIDLVTSRSMITRLIELLEGMGYSAEKRFNAMNANQRLLFWDHTNDRQLDVFVDRFEMCHKFDLRSRLTVDPGASTLPLADLLLTKMQVVEMNFKDMKDLAALLQDHPLTENEEGINVEYVTKLTRNDWGLQRTIEVSIGKIRDGDHLSQLRAEQPTYDLAQQLDGLAQVMNDAPKSTGWKLRAKVGERKRWYEVPEEARL